MFTDGIVRCVQSIVSSIALKLPKLKFYVRRDAATCGTPHTQAIDAHLMMVPLRHPTPSSQIYLQITPAQYQYTIIASTISLSPRRRIIHTNPAMVLSYKTRAIVFFEREGANTLLCEADGFLVSGSRGLEEAGTLNPRLSPLSVR